MTYHAYWGEKKGPNGIEKSSRVVSYNGAQVADKGAYKLLKQGWDVVKMDYMNSWNNYSHTYYLFFIDEMGKFGKKKGVICIDLRYCKGSRPTLEEVRSHGHYVLSDGSSLYFNSIKTSKNAERTNDFGLNWNLR